MSQANDGYESALRFILSRELFGMKLGLENISGFLADIGNPQDQFQSVHIAGTNGKGSTAAYLDSIFRQAGYKTGLFTSPHLADYRERIRINGTKIERQFITSFINRNRKAISRRKITYFEVCTALAFSYFARRKVNIAVIETGLGGRLDATNVLRPLLSIITDISYDHTDILGTTLAKIAGEKAGIIKEGVPVLTGLLPAPAARRMGAASEEKGSPISSLTRRDFQRVGPGFEFDFKHDGLRFSRLQSSLPGDHQVTNASLSIRAVEFLRESGYQIRDTDVAKGISGTVWPGRFQILKKKENHPTVILDVGHNPAGFKVMVECFKHLYPGRKAAMIIGMVRTKDIGTSVSRVRPVVRRAVAVRLKTHRSADPGDIVAAFSGRGVPAETAGSLTAAAKKLIRNSNSDDIIIICGSHYGVGEFIENRKIIYG